MRVMELSVSRVIYFFNALFEYLRIDSGVRTVSIQEIWMVKDGGLTTNVDF